VFAGAVFTGNTAPEIAAGVRSAIRDHAALVARAAPAREAQRRRWEAQQHELAGVLGVRGEHGQA
jgi:hypothetical protein